MTKKKNSKMDIDKITSDLKKLFGIEGPVTILAAVHPEEEVPYGWDINLSEEGIAEAIRQEVDNILDNWEYWNEEEIPDVDKVVQQTLENKNDVQLSIIFEVDLFDTSNVFGRVTKDLVTEVVQKHEKNNGWVKSLQEQLLNEKEERERLRQERYEQFLKLKEEFEPDKLKSEQLKLKERLACLK